MEATRGLNATAMHWKYRVLISITLIVPAIPTAMTAAVAKATLAQHVVIVVAIVPLGAPRASAPDMIAATPAAAVAEAAETRGLEAALTRSLIPSSDANLARVIRHEGDAAMPVQHRPCKRVALGDAVLQRALQLPPRQPTL